MNRLIIALQNNMTRLFGWPKHPMLKEADSSRVEEFFYIDDKGKVEKIRMTSGIPMRNASSLLQLKTRCQNDHLLQLREICASINCTGEVSTMPHFYCPTCDGPPIESIGMTILSDGKF